MPKVSIKGQAKSALAADNKARKQAGSAKTFDSLQNFAANLGMGLDNQLSSSTYGFNPITRNRTLLEWLYRGSWLAGVVVDVIADDMTRAGVDIRGDVDPEEIEHLERAATTFNIWPAISDTIKWARLYGGGLAVMLIDGQDPATPLDLKTVGQGQFRGLLVLDRWMVEPSLENLVTDMGPDLGNPKFYRITTDAPALKRMTVHYSRCLRMEGVRLPYWQRMMENLWGLSVLERPYDRIVAFDSATTGAAQLVYKAYLRVYKIDGMREVIGAGGPGQANLVKFVDFMRRMQSIEGITLIDGKDDLAAMAQPSFAGLSDALIQFGQQLGGSFEMPLTRLFGQSPTGMSATGESDLRTYYDGIHQKQARWVKVPLTNIYRAMAQSEGIKLPEGFSLDFRSLWVLSDQDKAGLGATDSTSVMNVFNAGVISPQTALKELRQLSKISGRFTNISDEEIDAASPTTGAQMAEEQHAMGLEQGEQGMDLAQQEAEAPPAKKKPKDAALSIV
jgi:phage-related protein (TIGR01555 family)